MVLYTALFRNKSRRPLIFLTFCEYSFPRTDSKNAWSPYSKSDLMAQPYPTYVFPWFLLRFEVTELSKV